MRPEALGTPFAHSCRGQRRLRRAGVASRSSLRRRAGRFGFAVLSALLIIDGLYLAYAMYVTGATQSPIRFLVYLHLVAVSLLASYRTGLKIALWHSLLLFVVLYAQAARSAAAGRRHPRAWRSTSTACRSSTSPRSGSSPWRRRSSRP